MKWLSLMLVVIAIVGALLYAVGQEPGYVLISYDVFTVETSVVFFTITVLLTVFIAILVFRSVIDAFSWPGNALKMRQRMKRQKSSRSLTKGLIDLAEGHWARAERGLLRHVENSQTPLLNYLAAARAAQMQRAYERRDEYLKNAIEVDKSADVAVGLSQAELQLSHGQSEQALATLNRINELSPKHGYVQYLLARLYHQVKDWPKLILLLSELRRHDLMDDDKLDGYESDAIRGAFEQMIKRADVQAVEELWSQLSRGQRRKADIVSQYAQTLMELGQHQQAIDALQKFLNVEWSSALVLVYSKIEHPEPLIAVERAEKWLKQHGRSASLMLALGYLCMQACLWGKARIYLETSLELQARPETYRVLGDLLAHHMNDLDHAHQCYEKGLILAVDGKVTPIKKQRFNILDTGRFQEELDKQSRDLYSV